LIYIDLIIIVVIIYAFIKGFYNGLINEIASFLGLFIGAIVSYTFSDNLSEILNSYFEIDPKVLNILSFILLFIITAVCFTIAGKSLTKLIKFISLGTINRLLGGLFSSLKFIIVIVSISMVINYLSELLMIEIIPLDQTNNSKVYPVLIDIGNLILDYLNNNSLTI
jgi:membrane protein required for colicin V production|tara:strand:- start:710 stop:1210 length:501 start_codon:yes stop_codon:yes gene_type:complete